jgi:hypothetical protein
LKWATSNLEQHNVIFRRAHVTGESTVVPGQETRLVNESAILLDGDVEARKQH